MRFLQNKFEYMYENGGNLNALSFFLSLALCWVVCVAMYATQNYES